MSTDVSWALHTFVVAAAQLDVALARRLGLSPGDYLAMKHVMTAEQPIGPVELGALVGLTSGAATTLVDRLEHAGHLRRHRNQHDRRRLALEAESDTIDATARELQPLNEALERITGEFTEGERAAIDRFLRAAADAYRDFSRR